MNTDVNVGAGITYGKLNLAGSLVGTDFAAGTLTLTNTNVSLGNNDNIAREIRLAEPSTSGTDYTALKAQAQTGNMTLTLPAGAPSVGQFLQVSATGAGTATLDWGNVGAGAIALARVAVNSSQSVAASTDIVGVDPSGGPITLTFPPAATAGEGHIIIVKDETFSSGTNNITIDGDGAELVEDQGCGCMLASTVVNLNGDAVRFYSDGVSNWYRW
ncbi:MAG TPA: hypothetical protein VFH43_05065 [Candidatus Kapabacteria bacterium]|nr:hypothetical protein [Candidatus Kapabacteria bacterium]